MFCMSLTMVDPYISEHEQISIIYHASFAVEQFFSFIFLHFSSPWNFAVLEGSQLYKILHVRYSIPSTPLQSRNDRLS